MLLAIVLVFGCGSKDDTSTKDTGVLAEPATEIIDSDQDGYHSEEDCEKSLAIFHSPLRAVRVCGRVHA